MRSLRPSLGATLRAACAVQIVYPADLSRLSFGRWRARAPSTRATAMLSVAGARQRPKSGAIIASTGAICGLALVLGGDILLYGNFQGFEFITNLFCSCQVLTDIGYTGKCTQHGWVF